MTSLAAITPRLRKLLLMLSSSQPGEVVAAANAIDRALKRPAAIGTILPAGFWQQHHSPKRLRLQRPNPALISIGGRWCSFASIANIYYAAASVNSLVHSATGAAARQSGRKRG
jgi:hypothetical protein